MVENQFSAEAGYTIELLLELYEEELQLRREMSENQLKHDALMATLRRAEKLEEELRRRRLVPPSVDYLRAASVSMDVREDGKSRVRWRLAPPFVCGTDDGMVRVLDR